MALVLKDRVQETTTTTGTGTITLGGAVTGYQSFSAIGNANTTYYAIYAPGGSEWEVGIGTYTSSGTTLSRDTVLASSNSGSLVSFSAGTKNVWCDYPAGKATYLDSNGKVAFAGASYEDFASIAAPSYQEGRVWYDSTEKALAFYNDSSALAVHVSQDLIFKVINNTGSTIPNGSPVYITSTSSGQTYPNVALARADVAATSAVIGLTNGAIANGAIGYVSAQGTIDNVNTSAFTVGQVLYLSPYSAGQLMNTIPPTGITVQVGIATFINSSTGKIYVKQTTPLAVPASIITGTLGIDHGGTGQSSALVAGSVVYGASTTAMGVTAAGTSGQVLTSQGAGTPTWTTPTTGTVTSVTGTAPVVSSGGNTPAISMAAATTSVNGYLTSTDWTTFNGKQALLVSGTNIKTINSNSILGSGDLTISASAAGSNTQVQYNNSGAFGASSSFTYSSSTGDLSAPVHNSTNGLTVNSSNVSSNYTIASGSNAFSVGPITTNSGVTVTVSSGQRWVVI
jgi:hypothetical protein